MADFEKLGAFYLGRAYDIDAGRIGDEQIIYDAKDLTTHAVCVGMTGSGKTGLGVAILEEAAIDGIPIIAIDPKGDLGNTLLTFPELRADDFRPWIDEGEATRKGRTPDEHARWTADLWRKGLADWGQDGKRVARFRDSVDASIYTPGSSAGIPLTVLRSFAAPAPAVAGDADALRERILVAVSGLLALLGVDADPIRSREHILISNILDRAWREGRDLDLPTLIRSIQSPSFDRVGVFDLESFYPAADRFELAMTLNNLIASPGFAAWTQGEPLDVSRLLYTDEGKPRLSIISIAHLSDAERMFLVTILLSEIVAWMRAQPGTRSLRAILYMDEVFGYFPPTANPPSKTPMLTLLKQARAYGLGVVLATQNPVDLDYKGLSNTGTWFLGRLQTERDKARVIEGLEGAAASTGSTFDRGRTERILAGLGSRVFLMNNVHEDEPVIFHTRWVLSYLGGPMTRDQIRRLTKERTAGGDAAARRSRAHSGAAPSKPVTAPPASAESSLGDGRPPLPPEITEQFIPLGLVGSRDDRLLYRPALLGRATLHYSKSSVDVDEWSSVTLLAPIDEDTLAEPWEESADLDGADRGLATEPEAGARFATLPAGATRPASYKRWQKMLASHVYRTHPLRLWRCKRLKAVSRPGETEAEFKARVRHLARERRDLELEKLRSRYAPKLARLQDQIRTAEERIGRERDQYQHQKMQTAISLGATVLGTLFGRKLGTSSTVGRATTTMRGAGRAARERGDIERATEKLGVLQQKVKDLEAEFEEKLESVREKTEAEEFECETVQIAPRKSDLDVDRVVLAWTPWRVDSGGVAERAY